jgi:hypothetical protein
MRLPIIASSSGDVLIFETVELAQGYIEPQDVEDNEYIVFDSEGRLLQLVLRTQDEILVEQVETIPNHAAQLQQTLINFLSQIGISKEWLQQASLEQLVEKGMDYKTE